MTLNPNEIDTLITTVEGLAPNTYGTMVLLTVGQRDALCAVVRELVGEPPSAESTRALQLLSRENEALHTRLTTTIKERDTAVANFRAKCVARLNHDADELIARQAREVPTGTGFITKAKVLRELATTIATLDTKESTQ